MTRDTVATRFPATAIARWGRLIVSTVARAYLVFVLALAGCALAPLLTGMLGSVVESGSMLPDIRVGDVVLSKPVARDTILPMGRVILFQAPAGSATTGLMLHRLVGVNRDGSLVTRGDANGIPDGVSLNRSDIIARACILIPFIGLPTRWLTTGAILPFALWTLATAFALLTEVLSAAARHRDRPRAPSIGRLASVTVGSLGLLVVTITGAALVQGVGVTPTTANFTARTTSVGSSWSSVAAATAVRLVFTTNPSGSTGGTTFGVQPVVAFRDASNHTTTSGGQVTLTLTTPGGASLSCAANPVSSLAGISTFAGCKVDKVGTYTVTARSGALIPATSAPFTITRGSAQRLVFVASPTATTANATFLTTPVVSVTDAGGNTVSSTTAISLSITTAKGATLTCATNPQTPTGGQATFTGCRINLPGSYTLTAIASGLANATSTSFAIGGPALPLLSCQDQTWMATFSWTPTPYSPTQYTLYINGIQVPATGADGWNSYVQLTSNNVPVSNFPQGSATLEVRRVTSTGQEIVVGDGTVVLGPADHRTYTCF